MLHYLYYGCTYFITFISKFLEDGLALNTVGRLTGANLVGVSVSIMSSWPGNISVSGVILTDTRDKSTGRPLNLTVLLLRKRTGLNLTTMSFGIVVVNETVPL